MRYSDLFETNVTFFHGSRSPISAFSFDFISSDGNRKLEGPGVYFTSSEADASVYGDNVHKVDIDLKKSRILPKKKSFSLNDIEKLIMASPVVDDALTDWGEDPKKALRNASTSIMASWGPRNFHDMVTQVWADFYRDSDVEWLNAMVKLGYDGYLTDRANGIQHFICYNLNIIKDVEVLEFA